MNASQPKRCLSATSNFSLARSVRPQKRPPVCRSGARFDVVRQSEPRWVCHFRRFRAGRRGSGFYGHWALPGGFVQPDEPLEEAVVRELREETGVQDAYIEQLHTFGKPDRDPRGRVISVAHLALVDLTACKLRATTDAARAQWFGLNELPRMPFDHPVMFEMALDRLRTTIRSKPMAFWLLPPQFTIAQLHAVYDAVLGRSIDTANFRKALQRMNVLKEVGEESDVSHRPARLFKFDQRPTHAS